MKVIPLAIQLAVALTATGVWAERKECDANPDPHFRTWDNTYYDYHGGCKLVLLHVPSFPLDVHISTVPVVGYSFIDEVGIRVGSDVVVINSSTGSIIPSSLGGNPLSYSSSPYEVYELTLGNGQFVRVTSWYGSLSVKISGDDSDFSGATGMGGTWNTPGLIDRSGGVLANGDEMGNEWKVGTADGPFIGSSTVCDDPIPHGGQCAEGTGCLCVGDTADAAGCQCFRGGEEDGGCACAGNGCVTAAEIEEACMHIADPNQQANCKYDVQTTGDVFFGKAPFYENRACTGMMCGDPHVQMWDGSWFDFHGQCDLIYLENPEFGNNEEGLTVHVRTSPRYQYSYIESAAIDIGGDVLEIGAWGEFFLNGVGNSAGEDVDMPDIKLGGQYPVTHLQINKKRHKFEVDLLDGQKIEVTTFKDMVNVKFDNAKYDHFKNSVGLLGKFGTGEKLGRNGTLIEDTNSFGMEWQVTSETIFQTSRHPQYPMQCIMPSPKSDARRLGASIAEDAANAACEEWGDMKEQCVFDVMATGDLELAAAGAY